MSFHMSKEMLLGSILTFCRKTEGGLAAPAEHSHPCLQHQAQLKEAVSAGDL